MTRKQPELAAKISELMRNTAYDASVDLAMEPRSPVQCRPLPERPNLASRLSPAPKDRIRAHGLRNCTQPPLPHRHQPGVCHNANGIEPAFSWSYTCKKRMPDGASKSTP
jgi:ribonucleoside-diphosphate reductase alpha chain